MLEPHKSTCTEMCCDCLSRNSVKETIIEKFAGPYDRGEYSPSVQKTLYDTQVLVLERIPEVSHRVKECMQGQRSQFWALPMGDVFGGTMLQRHRFLPQCFSTGGPPTPSGLWCNCSGLKRVIYNNKKKKAKDWGDGGGPQRGFKIYRRFQDPKRLRTTFLPHEGLIIHYTI